MEEKDYDVDLFVKLKDELYNVEVADATLLANSLLLEFNTENYSYFIWIEPTWNISCKGGLIVGSRGLQEVDNDKKWLNKYGDLIRNRIIGKKLAYIGINNCLDIEIGIDVFDYTWIRTFSSDHMMNPDDWFNWRITRYDLNTDDKKAGICLRCTGKITDSTVKVNQEREGKCPQ